MSQAPREPYCPQYYTGLRLEWYPQGYDQALDDAFAKGVKRYWHERAEHSTDQPVDVPNGVLVCWPGETLPALAALFHYRSTHEFWRGFLQDEKIVAVCRIWAEESVRHWLRPADVEALQKAGHEGIQVRLRSQDVMGYLTGRLRPMLTAEAEEVEVTGSSRQMKKALVHNAVCRWYRAMQWDRLDMQVRHHQLVGESDVATEDVFRAWVLYQYLRKTIRRGREWTAFPVPQVSQWADGLKWEDAE